jgi:uncharacterized protein (DUF488 family)
MKIYTIGFTQKSAETFFTLLADNDITLLADIRLRPGGQLSGFSKGSDLAYFLERLCNGCGYLHLPLLAPTKEILDGYRSDGDWARYERRFRMLMDERNVPDTLDRALFANHRVCLLCSEATPEQCHRRLVAERLARGWGAEVMHL